MEKIMNEGIKAQMNKKMDFFLKYFPARIRNVGEDAKEARNLIWAFKDARDNAFEKVAKMAADYLMNEYGNKVKDLVFVCVPASTREANKNRYKNFCKKVSELCGIGNGYSHVCVLNDRMNMHTHRHEKGQMDAKTQDLDFDIPYFKNKYVCVFDDIVTTGTSYAAFANQLEQNGAHVLGGLFLARTHYRYRLN